MARTKDEWRGKTDDAMPPRSVYLRLFRKQGGRCPACTRTLVPGNITREHLTPLEDGGENVESNIELWCTAPCARSKTGEENSRRAKADRMSLSQLGFTRKKGRPMPGSKASGWGRKMDGTSWRRT